MQRLKVLLIGTLIGAVCLGLYSLGSMPSAWSLGQMAEAWVLMMTGPFLLVIFGASYPPTAVSVSAMLAVLLSPLLFAYAVRPGVVTACLTLFALLWWFVAGWLTMIMAVWGA